MTRLDWIKVTTVDDSDTVIGIATRQKEWTVWINMSDSIEDRSVYVRGLDENGDLVVEKDNHTEVTEQLEINSPSIVLAHVKGHQLGLRSSYSEVVCKYMVMK